MYLALFAVCLLGLAGARPMLRGYPLGAVRSVDKETGILSVDLGSKDGVLKGMGFSVVDKAGQSVAEVTAKEVYGDLFWSDKLDAAAIRKVRPGMEVRWLLTPEATALITARKKDTVEAYRDFVGRFPASRFLPELIRTLPEDVLKGVNQDYYDAWKAYTKDAFQKVAEKYPGTGFARAAQEEIKSIEAFDAEGERIRQERAKRAAEAEAERKKQQEMEEKVKARREKARQREALGKLVNRSDTPVRFVFDPPGENPPVSVQANSFTEVRRLTGSYTYKVYKVEEGLLPPLSPDEQPQPAKEGSVQIMFDYWEAVYP